MWSIKQTDEDASKSFDIRDNHTKHQNDDDEVNQLEISINSKIMKESDTKSELQNDDPTTSGEILCGNDNQSIRRRSASRDSSLTDDPKSLLDSISGARELADDNPSICSIKGDSVSATIADYNRKHRAQISDNQSRTSARLAGISGGESPPKTDDLSSNINFFAAGGSTSGPRNQIGSCSKPSDFVSVPSNVNVDAFDIIEESGNVEESNISSNEDLRKNQHHHRHHHHHHHHHSKSHCIKQPRQPSSLERALDLDNVPQEALIYQIEPIILRGNGNLTLFGLSNSFSAEFPSALIGRVSREEFDRTMRRVNSLLRDQQSLSAKLLLFGGLCCCCSFGFSLVWPSIVLRKRSKMSLEKYLASENSRLYSKLGLNWKLAEQRCYSNHAFVEYVIMIEFTPKINLYLPD